MKYPEVSRSNCAWNHRKGPYSAIGNYFITTCNLVAPLTSWLGSPKQIPSLHIDGFHNSHGYIALTRSLSTLFTPEGVIWLLYAAARHWVWQMLAMAAAEQAECRAKNVPFVPGFP